MTAGRLKISGAAETFVEEIAERLVVIPISPKIAVLSARFSVPFPCDPAEALLVAQPWQKVPRW